MPASFLSVQLPASTIIAEAVIYNLAGQVLQLNQNQINLRSLPTAAYFLKTTTANARRLVGNLLKKNFFLIGLKTSGNRAFLFFEPLRTLGSLSFMG